MTFMYLLHVSSMFSFDLFLIKQQINAKTVMEVCSKYIYDQCPALVGVGMDIGIGGKFAKKIV